MSRLSDISASPTLREFAQGAAQSSIMPVADFLSPTIEVATSVGRYKSYTEKNRFHIPDTLRSLGGRASELRFEVSDATFNCEPHALDFPVDNMEQLETEGLENMLREGAVAVAEVAALAHEKTVIDAALAAVGAGTSKSWAAAADPISDVDDAILSVIKAAKYGSLMGVGILFGATAWKIFKNQDKVRGRFVVGHGGGKDSLGLAVPTEYSASQMFVGSPEVRTSYMIFDSAPEGKAESVSFLLDTAVLIFARKEAPTRRDPSFMKTFRLMNKFMVPGSYMRDDGRRDHMDADLIALRDEIDARLAEVEQTRGTCAGHPALARAIATLLRCQRAQLNQRAANTVAAAKVSGIVGALLIGVIEAAKHLFGK